MITFLDVETTFQINPDNRRSDPSPFHKDNKLVSLQYATGGDEPVFKWFYHQDKDVDPRVITPLYKTYFTTLSFW